MCLIRFDWIRCACVPVSTVLLFCHSDIVPFRPTAALPFGSFCMLLLLFTWRPSLRRSPISVFVHLHYLCAVVHFAIYILYIIFIQFAVSLGKLYANAKYGIRLSGNGFSSERAREYDNERALCALEVVYSRWERAGLLVVVLVALVLKGKKVIAAHTNTHRHTNIQSV